MSNRLLVDELEKRAIELFQQGKLQEAIQINLQIIDVVSDIHAYNRLGNAYFLCDENEKAIEAYRKALDINPHNPIAQRSLSEILDLVQSKPTFRQENTTLQGNTWSIEPIESKHISDFKTKRHDFKTDWQEFKSTLERYGVSELYHFTDRSNLQSIEEHGGLFSWSCLEQCGISIICPGGNMLSRDLDINKGTEDYVHLCFRPNQPMLYHARTDKRIKDPVIIRINTEVVYWAETMFSDMNATCNEVSIGSSYEDFMKIRLDIFTKGSWENEMEMAYYQAEVLVKHWVPLDYVSWKPNGQ